MRAIAALLLAAGLCAPALAQQVSDPLSKTAPAVITDKKTGGITADAAALAAASSTAYTAQQIYQMTTPVPVSTYDAVRGIAISTPGSTTTGVNGLAGYVVGNVALGSGGTTASPVALFGTGIANANGAYVWGINTLLTDNTSQVVSAGTGRQLWNELDFNVTSSNTTVRGLMLTGASIAQPALAVGIEVRPLGAASKWTSAYATQDGAAINGLALGAQGLGVPSSPSQLLAMAWSASDGTVYNHTLQSAAGSMTLDSTALAGTGNFVLKKGGFRTLDGGSQSGLVLGQQNSTGFLSDSQSLHFGYSNAGGAAFNHSFKATGVDGVLNLMTSGAPPSGSFNLPAGARYMVNGVAGVNCSGVPTASHATVGGITTVC
jgi:hypothetical protein